MAKAACKETLGVWSSGGQYPLTVCTGRSPGSARVRSGPLGSARDRSGPLGTARGRSGPLGAARGRSGPLGTLGMGVIRGVPD